MLGLNGRVRVYVYAGACDMWRQIAGLSTFVQALEQGESRAQPMIEVKSHLPNVLTYFKHRVTNAGSEAMNSVVQMLKKRAFGYRSFENFRTAILFHCGGLELYPLESGCHLKAE